MSERRDWQSPGARSWPAPLAALAALALSTAACEVLIGIPDVHKETGTTTGGAGGTGGIGGTGGAPCTFEPCAGAACAAEEIANGKDFLDGGGGGSKGTDISGVTARDGVVHWGVDRMPGGYIARTQANGITAKETTTMVPRRLADDGDTVYWSSVYSSCLGFWLGTGKPSTMGTCTATDSDRSPGIALDAAHVYWTVSLLSTCAAIPGCCGPGGTSCLVGAAKKGAASTVIAGERGTISDVVRVGEELFFAAQASDTEGTIERCPAALSACSPVVFEAGEDKHPPIRLAAAGGYVYWSTTAGFLRRKSLAAPENGFEDLAEGAYVRYMVGDEHAVYYTASDGKVRQLAHDNPVPVEIGDGEANYLGLDCQNVYWADGSALLRRPR